MPERSPSTIITAQLYSPTMAEAHFNEIVLAEGYPWVRRRTFTARENWQFDELMQFVDGDVIHSSNQRVGELHHLVRRADSDMVVWLHPYEGSLTVVVAARSRDAAMAECRRVERRFRDRAADDAQVDVRYWNLGRGGQPRCHDRRQQAPAWDEISANYAAPARAQLDELFASPPARPGVIIWQGEPGTGKTTALRALARAWRGKARTEVVLDPELLLGADCNYLIHVLLDTCDTPRLLVLEDAGELVSVDARARHGQAISRLLNITDGMIGQGIDLQVLITTNEPIGRLQEALRRPGRCVRHIEFQPLDHATAARWLAEHDCAAKPPTTATLAELFAIVEGSTTAPARAQPVGFAHG
jgi:hypothetical protein